MSLQLIYGKSGTGKTKYIFDEIIKNSKEEQTYIITPEQFSYTAERNLLKLSNTKSVMNCEVINFKHIASRLLKEVRRKYKN